MLPNDAAENPGLQTSSRSSWPTVMLFHRLILFLLFQALLAAGFALGGSPDPWSAGADWWPVSAILTNLTSIFLLRHLAAREGLTYSQLINVDFRRENRSKDLLALLGLLLLAGPIAMIPNIGLAQMLFGDAQVALDLFLRPLPLWGVLLAVLFPLTIAFAELPTYFGYVMPRLAARWSSPWGALVASGLLLGIQHVTLPFLFDGRFILWRAVMFIPFALLLGMAIRWRPRLMPYLMIVHVLMDMTIVLQLYQASTGA